GHAIDLGCGCSGRFMDLLTARGLEVEGLDVSARMIELARARHPRATFHHADVCAWEFPRRYDFITGWDSLWHLPLAAQEPVMRRILAALSPGGVFIFTTGGLDRAEEKTDAAMGPPVYYSVLGIPRTLALVAECGCVCRHLEYDQWPESHLVLIVQRADGPGAGAGAWSAGRRSVSSASARQGQGQQRDPGQQGGVRRLRYGGLEEAALDGQIYHVGHLDVLLAAE